MVGLCLARRIRLPAEGGYRRMMHTVRAYLVMWYALLLIVLTSGVWILASRGLAQPAVGQQSLRQIAAFELPGPPGKRFDYLTIDEDDHYLLSAHLGAGLLHVIDLR